jgi:ribosomal-protein-alanine N-acetyltransferase
MPAPSLHTPRLLLRPWRPEDLEPFAALNADPEVMRFFPAPKTRAETAAMLGAASEALERRGWGLWAVELPGVLPFIGFIGLNVPAFHAPCTPCVEVGWRLARQSWGQGYAPEGARAVLAHAFGEIGMEEVVAFTARMNRPSIRVMEKVGMVRDPLGDFPHPGIAADHPLCWHVLYRAKAREWRGPFAPEATGGA